MSDSLREPWLRGIAFNPAAPSDVLIRLVDEAAGEAGLLMCEGRGLPDAVVDAALRHPARGIRRALAGNRHVDPARLAPLATDPSGIIRARLASGPRPRPRWVRPLPDDILATLLTAQDGGEDGMLTEHEIVQERHCRAEDEAGTRGSPRRPCHARTAHASTARSAEAHT